MKTIEIIFMGVLATFLMASCQNDADTAAPLSQEEGETTEVKFELDVSSFNLSPATRAYTPEYTKAGFSIYAFKKAVNGTNFTYLKAIDLSKMTYTDGSKTLEGKSDLPIGTYKFIPAYGIINQAALISNGLTAGTTVLSNSLPITLATTATTPLKEIFLDVNKDIMASTEYVFGLTQEENQKVSATLKRAVSRVDIMFISADTVGGQFVEKKYIGRDGNILAGEDIGELNLKFSSVNTKMSMFATNPNTPVAQNFVINDPDYVVIGTGNATTVGSANYKNFDNVQATEVIAGGAHIFGTYLFPTTSTNLEMLIKPTGTNKDGRTIKVSNLPLERNKVTIVKVYVLGDLPIWDTKVTFEVVIDSAWEDGANEEETSIS